MWFADGPHYSWLRCGENEFLGFCHFFHLQFVYVKFLQIIDHFLGPITRLRETPQTESSFLRHGGLTTPKIGVILENTVVLIDSMHSLTLPEIHP